jgi:TolA-binding protein
MMLVAGLVLATLSSGCFWFTTKHEGNTLRRDMDGLETRLSTKEEGLEGKIQQLEAVLEEATKVLKRNSADLGADFAALAEQMRVVQGLVTAAKGYTDDVRKEVAALKASADNDREVLTRRLESAEQRLTALEDRSKQPELPASPDELWSKGKAAFDAGDHATAHRLFRQLIATAPAHGRAGEAQYYRGEALFRDNDLEGAIRELQKAYDNYKDGAFADDALFRAGEAAQRLKRCTEARAYFGLLLQKYPRSSLAARARAKDQELKAAAKDKAKCAN